MYYDWYKIAKIQQEAGLRDILPPALLSALTAVISGTTIWFAAQKFNVDTTDIENALTNPEIMGELQSNNGQQRTTVTQAHLDTDLLESLKQLEGTASYQRSTGSFRNNKFFPYRDTKGHLTIGYGHKILSGENYQNGITLQEADTLLSQDAQNAIRQTNRLLTNTPVTPEAAQVIANMTFQMGEQGVRGFSNMWTALENQDYNTASEEMLDSDWARNDSPTRARSLADIMSRQ